MPLRQVAPAGTSIGAATLAAWLLTLARHRGASTNALATAFAQRPGLVYSLPITTGRAGLVVILKALASLADPRRRRVIVPSYTCYTVAASVVHAGLSPLAVDISPDTLDFDLTELERLDTADVLAIVPTSLFGLPSDLPALSAFARRRGLRLVDDAAQALGAAIGGRASGTWGDAGLYSLDKGKNITTIDGGVAVTADPEVAKALAAAAPALTPRSGRTDAIKLLAYAALLRPWLYWLPNRLPGVQLGATHYPHEIPLETYPPILAAMGLVMLPRLEAVNAARRAVAAEIDRAVSGVPGLTRIRPHAGAHAVYLRYPLLAASRAHRDAILEACRQRGLGATGSYPLAIVDVPELAGHVAARQGACPNGRAVAERIVTLPTHAYVRPRDVAAIRAALEAAAPAGAPAAEPAA
jgi:dTDP-4-amino-4,6-dideoxygalactose transaminase